MGRKKKIDVGEPVPVSLAVKKVPYELTAKYKTKDAEGNKVIEKFDSKGNTVKELLASLHFPKGVVALVVVSLKRGEKVFEKALAPHKARKILEHKDEFEFDQAFRGI